MFTVQPLQDRTGSQLVGSYEERAEIQNLFTALRLLFFNYYYEQLTSDKLRR